MYYLKKYIKNYFTITPKERPEIMNIKNKFAHEVRGFNYGFMRKFVDSIACHATPGTIETVIKNLLSIEPKNKLLNLGGGIGQVANIFNEMGFDVYNLDVGVSKEHENEHNIQFDLNNNSDLPFAEKFFQVIVCQEVIEHLENPWKLIRDIKKVLEPNGLVIITTPNPQSIRSRLRYLFTGYFDWFTPECFRYHINPVFNWELEIIAKKTGFELVNIQGSGYYFKKNKKIAKKTLLLKNEGLIYIFRKIL